MYLIISFDICKMSNVYPFDPTNVATFTLPYPAFN